MRADLQTVRQGGMKCQQRAIEPRGLVGLRHGLDVMAIEHRAGPHDSFGRIVVGDESDEFHSHWRLLLWALRAEIFSPPVVAVLILTPLPASHTSVRTLM